MHWLDMLKVRDLMHAEVGARDTELPRDASAAEAGAHAPAASRPERAPWRGDTPPVSVSGDATLRRACILMSEHGLDQLLVTHRAWPVGTLSALDVVRYLASGSGL